MVLSDILVGLLLLFILSGYVLIPLTFLLIIILMKKSRKRKNKMDIVLNLCLGQRYLQYNLL